LADAAIIPPAGELACSGPGEEHHEASTGGDRRVEASRRRADPVAIVEPFARKLIPMRSVPRRYSILRANPRACWASIATMTSSSHTLDLAGGGIVFDEGGVRTSSLVAITSLHMATLRWRNRPGGHPCFTRAAMAPARSRVVALHCCFGAVRFAHGGARRWEEGGGTVPSFISRSRKSEGGWDRGKSRGARRGCCGGSADIGHGR
jgi:hypothetical protein